MKKIIPISVILIILIITVVSLNLWANKPSVMLIGQWKRVTTGDILTFYKDGTFTETDKELPVSGNFKFIDNNKIKADYDGVAKILGVGSMVMDIQINGGHLIITSPYNTRQEYNQVPDTSFDDLVRNTFSLIHFNK